MQHFLILSSGIAWIIVYIECIHTGIRQKTYCMPLFALGLNFGWEAIYSITGIFDPPYSVQTYINFAWCICDIIIIGTYFQYGKKHFPDNAKKYFLPFSILSLLSCFVIQLGFYLSFTRLAAQQYSAFLQNALMSILFLVMLFRRNSKEGQTMTIAIAKWIGTLAPTILQGLIWSTNIYIIICGVICSLFDLTYIYMLKNWDRGNCIGSKESPLLHS